LFDESWLPLEDVDCTDFGDDAELYIGEDEAEEGEFRDEFLTDGVPELVVAPQSGLYPQLTIEDTIDPCLRAELGTAMVYR
jgi:hypothetical protein